MPLSDVLTNLPQRAPERRRTDLLRVTLPGSARRKHHRHRDLNALALACATDRTLRAVPIALKSRRGVPQFVRRNGQHDRRCN